MSSVPEAAVPGVLRGLAQYVRATPPSDLPTALVPVKRAVQTPKGTTRHRPALLKALEDDAFRAQVGQWIRDNKKLPLSKTDLEILKLAVERPEGWVEALPHEKTVKARPRAATDSSDRVERERTVARKAKEEARKAREGRDAAVAEQRRASQALSAELLSVRRRVSSLEGKVRDLERAAEKARNDLERERRKARAALDRSSAQIDELKRRLREEKARVREARAGIRPEGARPERPAAKRTASPPTKAPRGPRKPLKPPKGRFEDEPETLDGWLARDDVHLVVDGYNLTRNEASYGHLSLEAQRERLLDLLRRFATQRKVDTTLVWDGGDVPPSSQRRRHGRVKVEFSPPGDEKDRADLHIVSLVKALPPIPVVVATNDRALGKAVKAEGATVVKAEQLLALLR